jgi:hypothetical protein
MKHNQHYFEERLKLYKPAKIEVSEGLKIVLTKFFCYKNKEIEMKISL